MKNKIIIIIIILLFLFAPQIVSAFECPYDEINCEGLCSHYIDKDNNTICDYSLIEPETTNLTRNTDIINNSGPIISGADLKEYTVTEIAEIYDINPLTLTEELSKYLKITVKQTDSFQLLHDNYGLEPSIAKDIALAIKTDTPLETTTISEQTQDTKTTTYNTIPLSIIIITTYIITWILAKKKYIRLITHRRLWNLVLLSTFLISGLLGILILLRIDYGIIIQLPLNILYLHVETGIAMTIIAIFHILWHLKYFKNIIIKSNKLETKKTKQKIN